MYYYLCWQVHLRPSPTAPLLWALGLIGHLSAKASMSCMQTEMQTCPFAGTLGGTFYSLWGLSLQIIHPALTFTLKPHLVSKMNILALNTENTAFQRTLDATRSLNPGCCWGWMQATCFKVQTCILPDKQINNTWCSLMGLWYAGIHISFTIAQWTDGHYSRGEKCVCFKRQKSKHSLH